jgi:hypothetical protein
LRNAGSAVNEATPGVCILHGRRDSRATLGSGRTPAATVRRRGRSRAGDGPLQIQRPQQHFGDALLATPPSIIGRSAEPAASGGAAAPRAW